MLQMDPYKEYTTYNANTSVVVMDVWLPKRESSTATRSATLKPSNNCSLMVYTISDKKRDLGTRLRMYNILYVVG